jgi:ribonuclease VapC
MTQCSHEAPPERNACRAHLALQAFDHYGKGTGHPARLNLGDCFIYAQARVGGAALLFKGDDFSKTDIESAP